MINSLRYIIYSNFSVKPTPCGPTELPFVSRKHRIITTLTCRDVAVVDFQSGRRGRQQHNEGHALSLHVDHTNVPQISKNYRCTVRTSSKFLVALND
jgi:hypothetical protein